MARETTMVPPAANKYRFFLIHPEGSAIVARPVDAHLQGTALAEMLKLELMQIADSSECQVLVINFEGVKLISSAVISSLLGVKRHLSVSHRTLKLCGMSESVRFVFRTLNMDGSVFEIADNVTAALAGSAPALSYYEVCGVVSPPAEETA